MKKILMILLIGLAFFACDEKKDDPKCDCTVKVHPTPCTCPAAGTSACDCTVDEPPADDPKDQSQTITFGANLSTNVTGHMTNSQWDNVIGKLTTALNAAANDSGDLGSYTAGFFGVGGYGISIDLVKNPPEEYQYYKFDAANIKIFLNADYVIGATQADLSAKIANSITCIDGSTPEQQ